MFCGLVITRIGAIRQEKKYGPPEIPIGTMVIIYRRALEAIKELLSNFPISWRKYENVFLSQTSYVWLISQSFIMNGQYPSFIMRG